MSSVLFQYYSDCAAWENRWKHKRLNISIVSKLSTVDSSKYLSVFTFFHIHFMSTTFIRACLYKNISPTGFFEDLSLSRKLTLFFMCSQMVESHEVNTKHHLASVFQRGVLEENVRLFFFYFFFS